MKKVVVALFLGVFACTIGASAQTSATTVVTAVDTTAMKAYVGKYKFEDAPFAEIIITLSDGKLFGEAVGQGIAELKPTNEVDVLEVVGFDGKVKFFRNDAKEIEKVELTIQGQTMKGSKQQ